MGRAGLTRADFDTEIVEVWPENWRAFQLLYDIRTQWRGAGSGVIGLDYGPLFCKMDRMHLSTQDYDDLESDVRVMELEALSVLNSRD